MSAIKLTTLERRDLRADAHFLHPVVYIGNEGLTANVLKEIDASLSAHGLIKIRVFTDDKTLRAAYMQQITEQLTAAEVQQIGKLLVVWRPQTEKENKTFSNIKEVKFTKYSKRGGQRPEVKHFQLKGNERLTSGGKVKRVTKRKTSIKRTISK